MATKSITIFCIALSLCSATTSAMAEPDIPCPTPGSAPQLPIILTSAHSVDGFLKLSLSSRTPDVSQRLKRFLLVPPRGPIVFNQVTANELSAAVESHSGDATMFLSTVTLPKPQGGHYRVLLEERDLASARECPMEFFEDLGTIDVSEKEP